VFTLVCAPPLPLFNTTVERGHGLASGPGVRKYKSAGAGGLQTAPGRPRKDDTCGHGSVSVVTFIIMRIASGPG